MGSILGLDLSLTSTGVAHAGGTFRIRPKTRGPEQLVEIRDTVMEAVAKYEPQAVAIEGYAFGARGRATFSIGELGGVVRVALHEAGIPVIEISPQGLKKFTTGKGNCDKDAVLSHAIREFRFTGSTNDEADAWMLYRMARVGLGHDDYPDSDKRTLEARRKAVEAVEWGSE